MDKVAELKETDILTILVPTVGFFVPLLAEKRGFIGSISRRTFKYGATDRHKLDVYYPEKPASNGKTPVLFHVYGGGYASGARTLPEPADLAYANIGAYFANKGFITVIADYRLLPEAKYPDPIVDVRDAIVWITENPHSLSHGSVTNADSDSFFIIGHSVGATNISTIFLLSLLPDNVQSRFRGAVLISGTYASEVETVGPTLNIEFATAFYGSMEKAKDNTPLSQINQFPKDKIATLPPFFLVAAEKDPESFLQATELFHGALSTLTGKQIPKLIGKGHNHISEVFALSTGQGEEWAEEVYKWMQGLL
ncbi:hypothetical protein GYMLUDRAFT_241425 [Collybiopsis luxurians FD-317 M1]|uniref:BD-FAE-like domain-containing protein n=1 Tax=Collybiopsis luxurians FD-317 M1 TaxID=944289 RepID=A0A0D0CWJ6_9AGAR|nr:hypothetical protein GYMLUDRAFT_241425 [Collybiopsis luxurians FD-317 M1]